MKQTDSFTFYILPGNLDVEATSDLFKASLQKMKTCHGVDYTSSKFFIKILKGNSSDTGYGYIRVTDSGLYNCIVGKNPNGTERVRICLPKDHGDV